METITDMDYGTVEINSLGLLSSPVESEWSRWCGCGRVVAERWTDCACVSVTSGEATSLSQSRYITFAFIAEQACQSIFLIFLQSLGSEKPIKTVH